MSASFDQPRTAERAAMAPSVRELRKAFGPKLAVAGIDLDIPHGCFFGLVGPNGAGKTTTLGMVTGTYRHVFGGPDGTDWRVIDSKLVSPPYPVPVTVWALCVSA